ncbi:MAG: hypothetical protein HY372_01665 [Candidatus Andersenbacteria bacterium]|nr:hypothetical protein [Candidatus Andersenbacteria bacterium]
MTVRFFIIGAIVAAISSWAIVSSLVLYLDPERAGLIGYFLFFLALFLAAASTASLCGYSVRRLVARHVLAAYAVRTSLRQGVWLALLLNLLLLLQLVRLYVWWLAVLACILLVTTEFIFLGYDRAYRRTAHRA